MMAPSWGLGKLAPRDRGLSEVGLPRVAHPQPRPAALKGGSGLSGAWVGSRCQWVGKGLKAFLLLGLKGC